MRGHRSPGNGVGMRMLFIVARVLVAGAIATAAIVQLVHSIGFRADRGATDTGFVVVNFFSFFTIDSNVASVVALLIGAVLLVRSVGPDPRWYTVLRATVVTYMVVTGVVYNLLLRNVPLPQGATVEWSNEILHVAGPVYLLLDWLFAPGRGRLEWRHLRVVVVFPIVWAVYTLIRGTLVVDELTGAAWYPYPFLNPDASPNGYLSVAFYVILIAGVICGAGAAVIRVSRIRDRWPLPAARG